MYARLYACIPELALLPLQPDDGSLHDLLSQGNASSLDPNYPLYPSPFGSRPQSIHQACLPELACHPCCLMMAACVICCHKVMLPPWTPTSWLPPPHTPPWLTPMAHSSSLPMHTWAGSAAPPD